MVLNDIYLDCIAVEEKLKALTAFATLVSEYEKRFIADEQYILNYLVEGKDSEPAKAQYFSKSTSYVSSGFYKIIYEFSSRIIETTMHLHDLKSLSFNSCIVKHAVLDFVDKSIIFLTRSASAVNTSGTDLFIKLKPLIEDFVQLDKSYNDLVAQIETTKSLVDETSEKIPEEIKTSDNYTNFTLRSSKETNDINSIGEDLLLISDILLYAENLTNCQSRRYRISKIESGSLVVILATAVSAVKLIDFMVERILCHQKSYLDVLKCKGELMQQRLDIFKELSECNQTQNSDLLDDPDLFEKLVVSTLKYLKLNPKGKINDREYDFEEQKLLEMASREDN